MLVRRGEHDAKLGRIGLQRRDLRLMPRVETPDLTDKQNVVVLIGQGKTVAAARRQGQFLAQQFVSSLSCETSAPLRPRRNCPAQTKDSPPHGGSAGLKRRDKVTHQRQVPRLDLKIRFRLSTAVPMVILERISSISVTWATLSRETADIRKPSMSLFFGST
jgi:hypothetical protein